MKSLTAVGYSSTDVTIKPLSRHTGNYSRGYDDSAGSLYLLSTYLGSMVEKSAAFFDAPFI